MVAGAGVSAESGLGTFRDKNGSGIWARFDPTKLATPEAFARDPVEVHAFYNARRRNLIAAAPNAAHFALAGWFCAATRPRRTSPAGDFFGVFFPTSTKESTTWHNA